jgi:DNA-binding NarL/FixJ family response regulator
MSQQTIKVMIVDDHPIFQKLNASDRTQAGVTAIRLGLVR